MSATMLVHGTIRQQEPAVKNSDGSVYGTNVSVLTEVGRSLGDTVRVLFFTPRQGDKPNPSFDTGRIVSWICGVEPSGRFLNVTFRREADAADIEAFSRTLGGSTFNVTEGYTGAESAEALSA